MEYLNWLMMALLGIGSGAYGVLVGAGGGFIIGPVLLLTTDTSQETVAGTVLAAIAINSILVAWKYRSTGIIDYRSGLLFAAAAVPGAVIGSFGVEFVDFGIFRMLFGVLLILLAIQLAFRPQMPENASAKPPRHLIAVSVRRRTIRTSDGEEYSYEFNEGLATSFNVALGFISSFFGIGGGFLRTPILVLAFGFPVRVAAACSVFALAIYGSAGAVTHGILGHIQWFPTLIFVGIGLAVGGQIGARVSRHVQGVWILRMLLIVVLVLGVRLIWQGIAEI